MSPLPFTAVYLSAGALLAAWHQYRYERDTGHRYRPTDHLFGVGYMLLWPLVLAFACGWWAVDMVRGRRRL